MNIKADWAEPCRECGAMDGCCATAKARLENANMLSRIVDRQSQTITRLERELYEAKTVNADLRQKWVTS